MLTDHLASFTDREAILSQFAQCLQSTRPGQFRLLAIKGNSGTGKTFLIDYLSQRICPTAGWQVGHLTFAQSTPDFRPVLEDLEGALKGCVPTSRLQQYREQREAYKRRFDEYRAQITISQKVEAREHSRISDIQQSVQVNTELRRRELQLRAELTRGQLELAEASQHPLCLFIDGYERLAETDSELVGWLWEEVLLKLARTSPQPVLVVTCGWHWPDSPAIKPFAHHETLDDFDEPRVSSYLRKQGVLLDDPTPPAQQELITAFYELTRGHPLVLALAVTYFKELPEQEHTPTSLRTKRRLVDEKARVEFLNERLLNRLPEPYRTLLERGPILRSFDQSALRALVRVKIEGATSVDTLDHRTYEHFLLYPFINQGSTSDDGQMTQPTFHDLVRRVRLETLRHHHPDTWEQLHGAMVEYYGKIVEAEHKQKLTRVETQRQAAQTKGIVGRRGQRLRGRSTEPVHGESFFTTEYAEWFAEIPEKEFQAQLEYLYHALQVRELQSEAFKTWNELTGRAVDRWRRQAGPLLVLVQQLVEEGAPFLNKISNPYGQYLICYSRFLMQETRWEEALMVLEEATQVFGQVGNPTDIATSLNNIGFIYQEQGEVKKALSYHERALALREQVGNPADIADSLINIAGTYYSQGKVEEALRYYKRALALHEQAGTLREIATSLNNIGVIYYSQGKVEEALSYHERALALVEPVGTPIEIAGSLNNIGSIYQQQGKLKEALSYYKRALALDEQVGNPANIAGSLNNIGVIYREQGKLKEALSYHKHSLALKEQVGNPADIALSLNNIGFIYQQQGKMEEALGYYQRALALREQVGNPADIANSLTKITSIYDSQGKSEEALGYHERALALREQVGNPADIAISLNNIGFIYDSQGKSKEALGYYQRALALFEQVGNPANIAISLNNIGLVYSSQGKLKKALGYYQRALALYEQVGNPADIALSLHNIARIYVELKEWEMAIPCYARSLHLSDSMGRRFESDTADKLEELAACYFVLGKRKEAFSYYGGAEYIRERLQKED